MAQALLGPLNLFGFAKILPDHTGAPGILSFHPAAIGVKCILKGGHGQGPLFVRADSHLLLYLLAFLTLIGLPVLVQGALRAGAPASMKFFFLCWCALLAWIWDVYLGIPDAVKVRDDDSLEFVSPMRQTVIRPGEIIAVTAAPLRLGFLDLRYRGGALRQINRMSGFYDGIAKVKALNPAVEIKGC
jgi:hypothetical protein